jgi:hypothetical protein
VHLSGQDISSLWYLQAQRRDNRGRLR